MNKLPSLQQTSKAIKSLLFSSDVSFNEKHKVYLAAREGFFKRNSNNTNIIDMIEICLIETNNCSLMKKQEEMKNCLADLKTYCSEMDENYERILDQKSWNYLIQHFSKDEQFETCASYWYKRIMEEKKIAPANAFTLRAMLKVFSNEGDMKTCEKLFQELKKMGQCNSSSYLHYVNVCVITKNVEKMLALLTDMNLNNTQANTSIYTALLKGATQLNNLELGMQLLERIKKSNTTNSAVSMSIITFALKVKKPDIAIRECEELKANNAMDIIFWTCLIQAYVQNNEIKKAISVIDEMKQTKFSPNSYTFTILMKGCADANLFEEGKIIHQIATKTLADIPVELSTSIINFYTKCGYPKEAINLCEDMKQQGKLTDTASWNSLMQAYIQNGQIKKSILAMDEMGRKKIKPNSTTFTILMKGCADANLFEEGKIIHQIATKTLTKIPVELSTSIINFYTKCGHADEAIEEFKKSKLNMEGANLSWASLIQAYVQNNEIKKAISVIDEMKQNQITPDSYSFTILMKGCADANLFEEGKIIHQIATNTLTKIPVELSTSIINFYTKCGHVEEAIKLCEDMKQQGKLTDTASWNCLIQAYIQNGQIKKSILAMDEMGRKKIKPNSTTFIILMKGCADANLFEEGKIIHQTATKTIADIPVELFNTIVNFYTKCGYPKEAIEEFKKAKLPKDLVSCNCLIQAYVQNNEIKKAISVIDEMKQNQITPDSYSFTILMKGCADANLFEEGKIIHQTATKTLTKIPVELSTSIINFYTKCGYPKEAIKLCEDMKQQGKLTDTASWNCLIQAHLENDNLSLAIEAFNEMKKQNIIPDITTYVMLLSGCGKYVAIGTGKKIIADIEREEIKNHEEITSSMVYFYSRIGEEATALRLFDSLIQRKSEINQPLSIITFNNMLACYAQHGKAIQAKDLYNEMVESKVEPNDRTFVIMLNAFSHCGMVEDAIQLFNDIKFIFKREYSVMVTNVMIDVFARSGRFKEAVELIAGRKELSYWQTLMGGCRKFNNIELGETVFEKLIGIDKNQAAPYILMSNIYTYHRMNEKASFIRDLMEENGIKKIPGIVYHEENGKLYQFVSGSTKYDKRKETELMREKIYHKIIKAGYTPDTRWVTNAKLMTEKEKIDSLCKHAEKIAIAHAFVLNPNRKRIVLTKNLRVCNDCHNATAYISKELDVEIIVRDANRYHHFKDGKCSCDDYW